MQLTRLLLLSAIVSSCLLLIHVDAGLQEEEVAFLAGLPTLELLHLSELCGLPLHPPLSPAALVDSLIRVNDLALPLLREALQELRQEQRATGKSARAEWDEYFPPHCVQDGNLYPKGFFVEPPIGRNELDVERDVYEWEFRSEELAIRPAVCLPAGSVVELDGCRFFLAHSSSPDLTEEICCHRHCSSSYWEPTSGAQIRVCSSMHFTDYEPGHFSFHFNVSCSSSDASVEHEATIVATIWWQDQQWTSRVRAEGRGISEATAGEEASFEVVMLDRYGARKTRGGDELFVLLTGPSLLQAKVHDQQNGRHSVSYTLSEAGEYLMEVLVLFEDGVGIREPPSVSGKSWHPREIVYSHIHGSPFKVACLKSNRTKESWREKRLCAGADALNAEGRWRHISLCEQNDPLCSLRSLPSYSIELYLWAPAACILRFIDSKNLLTCARDRNMRKLVVGGTSIQRTMFYDLVIMFNKTDKVDVTRKTHGSMRFSVPMQETSGDLLEVVFLWLQIGRKGPKSSVKEYVELAEVVKGAIRDENMTRGDVFIFGTTPYDIFQRPLGDVDEGAKIIARALAEMMKEKEAPLVVFRNADALHLPWLSYGRGMWGPVNGLAYPRSARVRESFSDAMQELQVPTLETFPLSAPRADQTHDGLHYFAINARDAQLRKGMKLMSNIVGLTILQLFLNYLCNE